MLGHDMDSARRLPGVPWEVVKGRVKVSADSNRGCDASAACPCCCRSRVRGRMAEGKRPPVAARLFAARLAATPAGAHIRLRLARGSAGGAGIGTSSCNLCCAAGVGCKCRQAFARRVCRRADRAAPVALGTAQARSQPRTRDYITPASNSTGVTRENCQIAALVEAPAHRGALRAGSCAQSPPQQAGPQRRSCVHRRGAVCARAMGRGRAWCRSRRIGHYEDEGPSSESVGLHDRYGAAGGPSQRHWPLPPTRPAKWASFTHGWAMPYPWC